MMNTLSRYFKPALLLLALVGFFAVSNGALAQPLTGGNAANIMNNRTLGGDDAAAGDKVIKQVYGIIKFAYVFFYAIAVLLVAQAWLKYKEQKYDAMFASMGAALGLFLTPAIIDFIYGLGQATATGT